MQEVTQEPYFTATNNMHTCTYKAYYLFWILWKFIDCTQKMYKNNSYLLIFFYWQIKKRSLIYTIAVPERKLILNYLFQPHIGNKVQVNPWIHIKNIR